MFFAKAIGTLFDQLRRSDRGEVGSAAEQGGRKGLEENGPPARRDDIMIQFVVCSLLSFVQQSAATCSAMERVAMIVSKIKIVENFKRIVEQLMNVHNIKVVRSASRLNLLMPPPFFLSLRNTSNNFQRGRPSRKKNLLKHSYLLQSHMVFNLLLKLQYCVGSFHIHTKSRFPTWQLLTLSGSRLKVEKENFLGLFISCLPPSSRLQDD